MEDGVVVPGGLRDGVRAIESSAARHLFRLGLWLDEIRERGAYRGMGYGSFDQFLAAEVLTLRPRAVWQLIAVVRRLRAWGLLTEDRMTDVETLGLAKLWAIVTVAGSSDEALDLIAKAKVMGVEAFQKESGSVRYGNLEGLVRFTVTLTPEQFDTIRLALRGMKARSGIESHARVLTLMAGEALHRMMHPVEVEELRSERARGEVSRDAPRWSAI